MRVTATKLRQNVYAILDQVAETGVPVEVVRKGKVLQIVPEKKKNFLDRLVKHDYIVGDPSDLVNVKVWDLREWREPAILDQAERERAARERRKHRPRK
jgi:prevent-host-death family protein